MATLVQELLKLRMGKPESGVGWGWGINACNSTRERSFPKTQGRNRGLEGPGQQESCKSPGLRSLFNVQLAKGRFWKCCRDSASIEPDTTSLSVGFLCSGLLRSDV